MSNIGSELFIVDNTHSVWKVKRYLYEWCELSKGVLAVVVVFRAVELIAVGQVPH